MLVLFGVMLKTTEETLLEDLPGVNKNNFFPPESWVWTTDLVWTKEFCISLVDNAINNDNNNITHQYTT